MANLPVLIIIIIIIIIIYYYYYYLFIYLFIIIIIYGEVNIMISLRLINNGIVFVVWPNWAYSADSTHLS